MTFPGENSYMRSRLELLRLKEGAGRIIFLHPNPEAVAEAQKILELLERVLEGTGYPWPGRNAHFDRWMAGDDAALSLLTEACPPEQLPHPRCGEVWEYTGRKARWLGLQVYVVDVGCELVYCQTERAPLSAHVRGRGRGRVNTHRFRRNLFDNQPGRFRLVRYAGLNP